MTCANKIGRAAQFVILFPLIVRAIQAQATHYSATDIAVERVLQGPTVHPSAPTRAAILAPKPTHWCCCAARGIKHVSETPEHLPIMAVLKANAPDDIIFSPTAVYPISASTSKDEASAPHASSFISSLWDGWMGQLKDAGKLNDDDERRLLDLGDDEPLDNASDDVRIDVMYPVTQAYGPYNWNWQKNMTMREWRATMRVAGSPEMLRLLSPQDRMRFVALTLQDLESPAVRDKWERRFRLAWGMMQKRSSLQASLPLPAPVTNTVARPDPPVYFNPQGWVPYFTLWPNRQNPIYIIQSNSRYVPPVPRRDAPQTVRVDGRYGTQERTCLPSFHSDDSWSLAFIPLFNDRLTTTTLSLLRATCGVLGII
ncbi:hypothetical protein EXIGLDRAFT_781575 [Exidia glandulosa HHB12029]|uniref:Uncharacterized protein n=1 Tax=Exidia glandulosa HHB12029 TaxID=1314781 RepID=A0A165Z710_EXIGL|nr:hypothetical protein EXIGLDRAFT_781575 [Exidia glandulosa HHB12029]